MRKSIKECNSLEEVEMILKLYDIQIKKTSTGVDYASMLAYDGVDKMDAKIWQFTPSMRNKLDSGEVYVVSGRTKEYQGKIQLNIKDIRNVTPEDNVDLDNFYEKAKMNSDELKEGINDYFKEIDDPILKNIVSVLLKKHFDAFFEYPAAVTIHHNYYYGLAYHTYSMLSLAKKYLENYKFINKDLVYAGIILHDVGKVTELSGPKGTEYTKTGKLLGHIVIGLNEVYATACDLEVENTEEVLNLLHIIASHHGELEYGSPKVPQTPEAELVHLLDYSDSRLAALEDEVTKTDKGEFTHQLFAFDRKMFYVPDVK